jgi:hypothetical protein
MSTPPGGERCSSRAGTFMPWPKRSSPSTTTITQVDPDPKTTRRSGRLPAWCTATPFCIAITHATASTTELNSTRVGGGFYAILNAYVSPQAFLATRSIDILVGSILGGVSSVIGAFIGALFVLFVPDWASEINPALGGLIYGLCLMGMILIARDGLVGLISRTVQRLLTTLSNKETQPSPVQRPAQGGEHS